MHKHTQTHIATLYTCTHLVRWETTTTNSTPQWHISLRLLVVRLLCNKQRAHVDVSQNSINVIYARTHLIRSQCLCKIIIQKNKKNKMKHSMLLLEATTHKSTHTLWWQLRCMRFALLVKKPKAKEVFHVCVCVRVWRSTLSPHSRHVTKPHCSDYLCCVWVGAKFICEHSTCEFMLNARALTCVLCGNLTLSMCITILCYVLVKFYFNIFFLDFFNGGNRGARNVPVVGIAPM